MPQYPIPQFIEEEGRIISFLTFRQFFLLVGGGGVCLLLYYLLPFWLFVLLGITTMLFVAALAFLKVGNESIVKIFLHYVGFSLGTKNYIWGKKELSYPTNASGTNQSSIIGEIKKMVETKK